MKMSLLLSAAFFVFSSISLAEKALAEKALAEKMTVRQTELLVNNCIQCHAFEESSAPQFGEMDDWQERIARGEEQLLKHVIEGYDGMPSMGYCSACSEEDFRAMVRAITELATPEGAQ